MRDTQRLHAEEHDLDDTPGRRLMLSSRIVARPTTPSSDGVPSDVEQCRQFFKVPDDDLAPFWQGILDGADAESIPITVTKTESIE